MRDVAVINLSKGVVKPSVLFCNLCLLPFYALICVGCVMSEYLTAFLLFLSIILINCLVACFTSRNAKFRKYWLSEKEKTITIQYPNVLHDLDPITLNTDQIVKVEYYRLWSPRGWLAMLHNYLLPQCVFITFVHNGREECKLIGHPDRKEIYQLCQKHSIPFELR